MIELVSTRNSVPFPQADSMDKIMKICGFLKNKTVYPENIAKFMDFTKRQAYLYLNAGIYLNLIKKEGRMYLLTEKGNIFASSSKSLKKDFLLSYFLKNKMLQDVIMNRLFYNKPLSRRIIIDKYILRYYPETEKYSISTLDRRARTILSWLYYIQPTIDSVVTTKYRKNYLTDN